MPSMHLYMVHKKLDGYSNSLDKRRQEVFDWLVFEVAGRREEMLINHHVHTEAMMINILIKHEDRPGRFKNALGDRGFDSKLNYNYPEK